LCKLQFVQSLQSMLLRHVLRLAPVNFFVRPGAGLGLFLRLPHRSLSLFPGPMQYPPSRIITRTSPTEESPLSASSFMNFPTDNIESRSMRISSWHLQRLAQKLWPARPTRISRGHEQSTNFHPQEYNVVFSGPKEAMPEWHAILCSNCD